LSVKRWMIGFRFKMRIKITKVRRVEKVIYKQQLTYKISNKPTTQPPNNNPNNPNTLRTKHPPPRN
jgi:hypothetical protein